MTDSIDRLNSNHPMSDKTPFTVTKDHADTINALLANKSCTYVVGILRNDTNEVRFIPQQLEWTDNSLYWWSEGNMGCDCNRHLQFNPHADECPCGHSRYSIVGIWLKDGSHITDTADLNPSHAQKIATHE